MIRQYAVRCLEGMSDDTLLSYLLQLTQGLKYELHLDNALTRFLLSRALRNQRLGHYFFWHLRSEMHEAHSCVRLGLILEAYCRGCGSHLQELAKQVQVMSHLEYIGDKIKDKNLNKSQKTLAVKDF